VRENSDGVRAAAVNRGGYAPYRTHPIATPIPPEYGRRREVAADL